MAERTVLLAAGGTGGHLFPAEALAHEMAARGWCVHLATDSRASRFAGTFPAQEVHEIASATIASRNPLALARAFLTLWRGGRQASALISRIRPRVVVGFGGYPTLPPLWAATRRGVPSLIHEQNAVMGRANRALSARVTAIAGGFLPEGGGRHAAKTITTGNPVRPAVLEAARTPYEPPQADGPFRLLVFGGSQGARFFSQTVPAALEALDPGLRARFRVTQQARAEDAGEVKAAYESLGVEAEIAPFFTDLARRMGEAHLVISRSGASTVSEIAVIGRPAVLVPYPHALDHDQAANAAALEKAGGALVRAQAGLDAQALAALLDTLTGDPARLAAMADAARATARPDAARLLAELAEAIASGHTVAEIGRKTSP